MCSKSRCHPCEMHANDNNRKINIKLNKLQTALLKRSWILILKKITIYTNIQISFRLFCCCCFVLRIYVFVHGAISATHIIIKRHPHQFILYNCINVFSFFVDFCRLLFFLWLILAIYFLAVIRWLTVVDVDNKWERAWCITE